LAEGVGLCVDRGCRIGDICPHTGIRVHTAEPIDDAADEGGPFRDTQPEIHLLCVEVHRFVAERAAGLPHRAMGARQPQYAAPALRKPMEVERAIWSSHHPRAPSETDGLDDGEWQRRSIEAVVIAVELERQICCAGPTERLDSAAHHATLGYYECLNRAPWRVRIDAVRGEATPERTTRRKKERDACWQHIEGHVAGAIGRPALDRAFDVVREQVRLGEGRASIVHQVQSQGLALAASARSQPFDGNPRGPEGLAYSAR